VHPAVFDAYRRQRLPRPGTPRRAPPRRGLSVFERAVLRLLRRPAS